MIDPGFCRKSAGKDIKIRDKPMLTDPPAHAQMQPKVQVFDLKARGIGDQAKKHADGQPAYRGTKILPKPFAHKFILSWARRYSYYV